MAMKFALAAIADRKFDNVERTFVETWTAVMRSYAWRRVNKEDSFKSIFHGYSTTPVQCIEF